MAYEFRLQDPGEGIHEAEIIELLVEDGDTVERGQNVLVAETDKAAVEIPSPVAGKISEIKVAEGDIVEVGDTLMLIEEEGAGDDEKEEKEEEEEKEKEKEKRSAAAAEGSDDDEEAEKERDEAGVTAREKDEAEDAGKEKKKETEGKAKGDRKAKRDEDDTSRRREEEAGEPGEREAASGEDGGGPARPSERPAKATPAVRKLARDLDVDLKAIDGSGEEGRILKQDVQEAAGEDGAASGRDDAGKAVGERRETLRSVRRATAQRMARAWREIPHVTHEDRAEITALERLRRSHGEAVEAEGGKLTLTPFLIKAIAAGLREHPRFNARFDAEAQELVYFDALNVGVALDTERGLLVPVLREVDRKSVVDLALELGRLAEELRNERPRGDVLKGGTFTLTNVGALGGTGLSPMINPPQVAIFGAARAGLEQIVEGTLEAPQVRVGLMLPICVGFDHRVIDGADAARFTNTVKALLEDPQELLIHN